MNLKVVNKEIIFAKYRITATKSIGNRTITKALIAFDDEQREEIVNKYDGWNIEIEELQWNGEIIEKADRLRGKVLTKSEAIRKLTDVDSDDLIQSMALAIATLDAELQTLKGAGHDG